MRGIGKRWVLTVAVPLLLAGTVADAMAGSAARKAGRGLAAMTTGFLEVPGNMLAETRRRGPAYGVTLGFVKGLGGIVVRELVGVYEFVTAPIEVPEDYRPLITPEYPWGYFDESRELADSEAPHVARR
jgi:putative exosortase-associated protein (TIGR04073 family)